MFASVQFATQQQAIIAGDHEIQHDQVDLIAFYKAAHLPTVGDNSDAQAVLFQVIANCLVDIPVIVND